MVIKRKDLWWKGKRAVGRSGRKRTKEALHFRNIAPGQMRPKGVRKENPLPLRNNYYYAIDWGAEGQPCLVDWKGTPEEGALGGQAAQVMEDVRYSWSSHSSPSYIFYDDAAYLELNGTIREMAHIRGNTEWDDIDNSHIVETIQHTVGHEYWLRCSMDVIPGQIITNQDALQGGLVVAEYLGNGEWRSTQSYHAPRKYESVWEQVKEWKSDDGLITAEDYYRRVTGHVLFNPCFFEKETSRCNANTYVFQNKAGDMEFFRQDWVYQSKAGIRCIQEKIEWSLFPQFIITLEYSHKWGQFTATVQHKTDRDGPCGTCRGLMEQVPIAVGEVLL